MKNKETLTIRTRCFLAILLYLPLLAAAQPGNKYPQGYFRWPLNLSPQIVANLGELRDNHWHMGLDIRTNQKVNQPVYASAEGYIASIGIRPLSFGRFIVINHPNGLSTLYAHLNDFFPALEKYVTDYQYSKESWAIELQLPPDRFPVKKGSLIAYSGSTGGSQGPHVHFEIRDTKTGKCLNPLLFGMPLQDKVPPSMVKIAMYDRNRSVYEQSPKFYAVKNTGGKYVISGSSLLKSTSSRISFAIQAFDRINGSANQDGIYSAKLYLDNRLQTLFIIDSIDYDATRYMNAQVDYKYRARGGPFIQHVSRLPGDLGGVYHSVLNDGVIELPDTEPHSVRIEITDAYGNNTFLDFNVQYDGSVQSATASSPEDGIFTPNSVNVLEKPDFECYLPENSLYDFITPVYSTSLSSTPYSVSSAHRLNDDSYPLHSNLTVRLKANKTIPADWKNKLVIRRTDNGNINNRAARLDNNAQWISAEFNDFGVFQAFADISPPTINSLGSADTINLSAATRIVFTPADNSGIKSFRAELDDQWLRFTNDKARSWIYIFDERCPYGVHKLKVTVEDIVGNRTTQTWWFKKYPYTPTKKAVKKRAPAKKKAVKKRK